MVCAVLGRPSLWGGRCSGDLAAAGDGGCCHDERMLDAAHPQGRPPYVRCAYPIPVEVQHDDGSWYAGSALAYCGERVTVRYSVDVGAQHHLVVDASLVRRA